MTVAGTAWEEPDGLRMYHVLLRIRDSWAFRLLPKATRMDVLKIIGEIR